MSPEQTTHTWLSTLEMEIENLPDSLLEERQPNGKIKKSERIIGKADPYSRKLYVLAQNWENEAIQTILKLRYTQDDGEDHSAEIALGHKLKAQAEAARELFWINLRDYFNTWDGNIGIRKDWTLVATNDNPDEMIKKVISNFLGE